MTLQELFNLGWNHFVVNKNPKSLNADGVCSYGRRGGNRCLIGLADIEDALVDVTASVPWQVEWQSLSSDHKRVRDFCSYKFPTISLNTLREYQNQHDSIQSSDDFSSRIEENLTAFAKKHGLEIPGCTL